MKDKLDREIDYIRVSVTDRCNLRCRYCMPEEGVAPKLHSDILSYENMELILKQCASLGISRVRLTGGEPLVRKGLVGFIERLTKIDGIKEVNLTTNGILLPLYAHELKAAGVKNINISLDTLDPEKFSFLTRGGDLNAVLKGIDAAYAEGFDKIKINTVMMKGFNTGETGAFLRLIKDKKIYLRFIELMPIGEAKNKKDEYISSSEFMKSLPPLYPAEREKGTGPASYYSIEGYEGYIGFIDPVSSCFCGKCNRIRLTSDGKLIPCLYSDKEVDLKPYLDPADEESLKAAILKTVDIKPEKHNMEKPMDGKGKSDKYMVQVGG